MIALHESGHQAQSLAVLLSDIVDSTRLNEAIGDDAARSLWLRHDREARLLMRRWKGQEIGRSDGFLVCFNDVSDAVGFATDYHRGLSLLPHPFEARIGVH